MNIDEFTTYLRNSDSDCLVITKVLYKILGQKAEELCCKVEDLLPVLHVYYEAVLDCVVVVWKNDNYPEHKTTLSSGFLRSRPDYYMSYNISKVTTSLEEYLEPIVAKLSEVNKEKIAKKRRADWDAALKTRLRDMLPPRI